MRLFTTFSAPDITRFDGIYSQYLLPLSQAGYYSSICALHDETIGSRIFPLPSFHVENPYDTLHDSIAPNRITDLSVTFEKLEHAYETSTSLEFRWTAPGDDFNVGRASYYKIYCGYNTTHLSYHDCKSLSETAMYAHPAGTQETFRVNRFTDLNRVVFFAIRTTDGSNEAEESNIVSVFVPSVTTTSKFSNFMPILYFANFYANSYTVQFKIVNVRIWVFLM